MAGRLVDQPGSRPIVIAGLTGIVAGTFALAILPVVMGRAYVAALALTTASCAFFQATNNALIIIGTSQERRGTISGLMNLSRNAWAL